MFPEDQASCFPPVLPSRQVRNHSWHQCLTLIVYPVYTDPVLTHHLYIYVCYTFFRQTYRRRQSDVQTDVPKDVHYRQAYKQTYRQKYRHRHTDTDIPTQTDRQTAREPDRHTDRQRWTLTDGRLYWQTDIQMDRHTDRRTDGQKQTEDKNWGAFNIKICAHDISCLTQHVHLRNNVSCVQYPVCSPDL